MNTSSRYRSRRVVILRVVLITLLLLLAGMAFGLGAGVLISSRLDVLPRVTFVPMPDAAQSTQTGKAFKRNFTGTLWARVTEKALSATPTGKR